MSLSLREYQTFTKAALPERFLASLGMTAGGVIGMTAARHYTHAVISNKVRDLFHKSNTTGKILHRCAPQNDSGN